MSNMIMKLNINIIVFNICYVQRKKRLESKINHIGFQ